MRKFSLMPTTTANWMALPLVRVFGKNFLLNPDNKINKPLYGIKGREVLAGQKIDPQTLPAGISTFQEALTKYYAKP